jgi:hypothetical protein
MTVRDGARPCHALADDRKAKLHMGRLATALKIFLRILRDDRVAEQAERVLADAGAPVPATARPRRAPVKAPRAAAAATATAAVKPAPAVTTTAVAPAPQTKPVAAPVAPPPATVRSDSLTLLSVLQREARFVDFFKEEIAGYADAQIGAAVRDVHRDTAAALERMFALRPALPQAEGAGVEVAAADVAGRVRLTGNVSGQPPYRGTLRHGGWEATKVQLPEWSGANDAARVVAPAEVEL